MRSICVSPLGSVSDRQLAEAATASRHAPRLEQLERSHQDPVAGQYLVHERAGGWAEDRVVVDAASPTPRQPHRRRSADRQDARIGQRRLSFFCP